MLHTKESVMSLGKKTTQHWVFYIQVARKYSTSLMTDPLNIKKNMILIYDY